MPVRLLKTRPLERRRMLASLAAIVISLALVGAAVVVARVSTTGDINTSTLTSDRREKIDLGVARADLVADILEDCDTSDDYIKTSLDCVVPAFTEQIERVGVAAMLNGIGLYRVQQGTTQCHATAHALGRAAWPAFKDLRAAFIPKAGLCEYGYYHGVLQGWALSVGPDEVIRTFPDLCSRIRVDGADPDCVHASGHAVSIFLDDAIAERACLRLTDSSSRASCWYGYEMELREFEYHKRVEAGTRWIPDRQRGIALLAQCSTFDDPDIRRACFAYRPAVIEVVADVRAMDMLDICLGLLSGRDDCFIGVVTESLSMNTSLEGLGGPTPAEICNRGGDADLASECFIQIGRVRILVLNVKRAGDDVCAFETAARKRLCLDDIEAYWRDYEQAQDSTVGTGEATDLGVPGKA